MISLKITILHNLCMERGWGYSFKHSQYNQWKLDTIKVNFSTTFCHLFIKLLSTVSGWPWNVIINFCQLSLVALRIICLNLIFLSFFWFNAQNYLLVTFVLSHSVVTTCSQSSRCAAITERKSMLSSHRAEDASTAAIPELLTRRRGPTTYTLHVVCSLTCF